MFSTYAWAKRTRPNNVTRRERKLMVDVVDWCSELGGGVLLCPVENNFLGLAGCVMVKI